MHHQLLDLKARAATDDFFLHAASRSTASAEISKRKGSDSASSPTMESTTNEPAVNEGASKVRI
jgi:hypothetical protein